MAVHNLAEGMCEIGHEVHVVAPGRRNQKNDIVRKYQLHRNYFYPLHKLPIAYGRRLFLIACMWRVFLECKVAKIQPDIVHSHYAFPAGYVLGKICCRRNIPHVLTCHGSDIQKMPEIQYGKRLDPDFERYVQSAVHSADGLIAIGRDVYREYLHLGVSENNVKELPNGINFNLLANPNMAAKTLLGLSEEDVVFLAVGRNHPKKGFVFLIEAAQEIAKTIRNFKVLIVGSRVEDLREQVNQLGLSDTVILYGAKAPVGLEFSDTILPLDEKIETFFHAADVYVMPSLIESMGLVTVEALASGVPIVGFTAEGTKDILQNAENCILSQEKTSTALAFGMMQMMERLKNDKYIGLKGRDDAKKFDRVTIAQKHIEFFSQVLATRRC